MRGIHDHQLSIWRCNCENSLRKRADAIYGRSLLRSMSSQQRFPSRYAHIPSIDERFQEMQFPIYSNHGASMRNKIFVFKLRDFGLESDRFQRDYKFTLVFENNNVTDYV